MVSVKTKVIPVVCCPSPAIVCCFLTSAILGQAASAEAVELLKRVCFRQPGAVKNGMSRLKLWGAWVAAETKDLDSNLPVY